VVTATFRSIEINATSVTIDGSIFYTGDTITYNATLYLAAAPPTVDIYLGALLPDDATFLSLVSSSGINVPVTGRAPVPYLANVPLLAATTSFPYLFNGAEAAGSYLTYALIARADSDPLVPANQLSISTQAFVFFGRAK